MATKKRVQFVSSCLHEQFLFYTEAEKQVKHNLEVKFFPSFYIPVYVRMNNTV